MWIFLAKDSRLKKKPNPFAMTDYYCPGKIIITHDSLFSFSSKVVSYTTAVLDTLLTPPSLRLLPYISEAVSQCCIVVLFSFKLTDIRISFALKRTFLQPFLHSRYICILFNKDLPHNKLPDFLLLCLIALLLNTPYWGSDQIVFVTWTNKILFSPALTCEMFAFTCDGYS